MKDQTYLLFDYETRSKVDLKKVGASEYARHPSTEIICCAWRYGTKENLKDAPTRLWTDTPHDVFIDALLDKDVMLIAHNAFFEQVITHHVVKRHIPPERWICTAAMAAALALPRKLADAAKALGLPVQKDMEGHRLMLKHSKPRRPSKKYPSGGWYEDPEERQKIYDYCKQDIAVEVDLFLKLPELNPFERKIWVLDQKINHRGVLVDRELIATAQKMIVEHSKALDEEVTTLTNYAVTSVSQRDKVLSWLSSEGVDMPDLQQKTVEDAVSSGTITGDALRVLEMRLSGAKTSTAKYAAFEQRSRSDGRLRDILVYHAASTGRWGGSGVQLQNLPRALIEDTDLGAEIIKEGCFESLKLFYGSPMDVLSSCLRSVLVAPKGRVFDTGDFASIELRVLFWIAKHEAGLQALRDGRDLYRELAVKIFGVRLNDVDTDQRYVGKQATLGAGFQMSGERFVATCAAQGKIVSLELGKMAIAAYRETHHPVVQLWKNIANAAITAVERKSEKKVYTINRTKWWCRNDFLWCELPSGRRLAYHKPQVVIERNRWGYTGPVLYHYGINALTKQWEKQSTYGGKLVENCVQAVARDLLAEAMLRVEATGRWWVPLHVHDELVGERGESVGSNEEFCKLMAKVPSWAEGLPIKVESWVGKRYRK